jgi:hypothetical protein
MNDERLEAGAEPSAEAVDGDAIETAGGVAAAGRRAITEDWAATILGLALLLLTLAGVIGKGMVP